MSYTPPRGPCGKPATVMGTCRCLRFMVHPLKVATSFECDGCGHHASFHQMSNPSDEEIVRQWKEREVEKMERRLMIENNDRKGLQTGRIFEDDGFEEVENSRPTVDDRVSEEHLEYIARPTVAKKRKRGPAR